MDCLPKFWNVTFQEVVLFIYLVFAVRYFWEKQYCGLVLKLLDLAPQLKITTNGELYSVEQQQQKKTWKILLLWTQDLWHGQMAKHLNWKAERSLVIELKLD